MLDVCLFYLKFIMSMFLEMIMLLRNKRGILFYFVWLGFCNCFRFYKEEKKIMKIKMLVRIVVIDF